MQLFDPRTWSAQGKVLGGAALVLLSALGFKGDSARSAVPASALPQHCQPGSPEWLIKLAPGSSAAKALDEVLINSKASLEALTAAANAELKPALPIELKTYRQGGEASFIVSRGGLARRIGETLDPSGLDGFKITKLTFGAERCDLRAEVVRMGASDGNAAGDARRVGELETRVRKDSGLAVQLDARTLPEAVGVTLDYKGAGATIAESLRKRPDVAYVNPNAVVLPMR